MPTATARRPTAACSFALRRVGWILGCFGPLRLGWTETHLVLPSTRPQEILPSRPSGVSTSAVETALRTGTPVVSLAALWSHGRRTARSHPAPGVLADVQLVRLLCSLFERRAAWPAGAPLDVPREALAPLREFGSAPMSLSGSQRVSPAAGGTLPVGSRYSVSCRRPA